jgi:outer membrane protein assembly factor BamC
LIRDTLSRVFGTRYSTSERDAFRARLESVGDATEIYISHRGMEEVITEERDGGTRWQPRATDHELEVEFLRRLMTFLGTTEEQANQAVATSGQPAQSLSELVEADSGSVLRLREGFDRAWRRIGLALDRGSFTVEDRNRSAGTYYVRYIDTDHSREKPGFLGRVFGSKEEEKPRRYRVVVAAAGTQSDVSVLAAQDATEPASNETTRRMLAVIQEKLGR